MNSSRVRRLIFALAVLAVAGWFMRGYITDDTYIHLRYAHNFIERGEFSFNPGASSYGATSPLWIFGLALLLKMGFSPFVSAWLLGALSGLGVVLLMDAILERMTFSSLWRGFVLILAVSDPWFLRWTFSGMETPLATFFLLALLFPLLMNWGFKPDGESSALWPRYLAWGVTAGLAGLVRPEFMILVPLALPWLLMFEYFRAGSLGGLTGRYWARPYKPLGAAAAGWALAVLPWFIYAWSSFGRITPGTASAKSSALTLNPVLLIPSYWQSIRTLAAGQGVLWIVVLVLIGLVLLSNRRGDHGNAKRWQDWRREDARQPGGTGSTLPGTGPWSVWGPVALLGIVATWTVVLLTGYAAKQVWIISRYISPLTPVLLLAMARVAEWMLGGTDLSRRIRRAGGIVIGTGVVITFFLNSWIMTAQVVPHAQKFSTGVRECYLGAGEWLRLNTPEDSVVAALDIGAVGYASDRPVLDLMGLVSPEILVLGAETGFQEMVEQGLWLDVAESTSGNRASYLVDRSEGAPRWKGRTVRGVRFQLLETCIIEGVGLREPQPWTVALYRLISDESRVKSSAGK